MRPTAALLALLPALVAADFTIYTGTCTNGITDPISVAVIHQDSVDACGGCGFESPDDVGAADVTAGNPCNPINCSEDPLNFIYHGDTNTYDIIVANTGINVGVCNSVNAVFETCNTASLTCLHESAYRCITYYCN